MSGDLVLGLESTKILGSWVTGQKVTFRPKPMHFKLISSNSIIIIKLLANFHP